MTRALRLNLAALILGLSLPTHAAPEAFDARSWYTRMYADADPDRRLSMVPPELIPDEPGWIGEYTSTGAARRYLRTRVRERQTSLKPRLAQRPKPAPSRAMIVAVHLDSEGRILSIDTLRSSGSAATDALSIEGLLAGNPTPASGKAGNATQGFHLVLPIDLNVSPTPGPTGEQLVYTSVRTWSIELRTFGAALNSQIHARLAEDDELGKAPWDTRVLCALKDDRTWDIHLVPGTGDEALNRRLIAIGKEALALLHFPHESGNRLFETRWVMTTGR